ncbi:hypothetical protein HYDPIDRAFT_34443 [Hydnomerulius pinastri MD-312]|uniref:Uncharacterized protein n=1 Tax=Hydnomerulius pinastri MD-312 TaxID=994086 RepID=A0A0C9UYQ1_9AGAM|nr:hypothetical protein HYDPIDRAFT_34443 [Hydnomerulius pinastri MD-312]
MSSHDDGTCTTRVSHGGEASPESALQSAPQPGAHSTRATGSSPTYDSSKSAEVDDMTGSLHMRKALHQSSTPPGRPLSYKEMVQRWCQALAKREAIRRALEEAQQEFSDYESEIVRMVGQATYTHFRDKYTAALTSDARHHQLPVVSHDTGVRTPQRRVDT